jgi:uncharacterized protein
MANGISYPGVYVEELPAGVRSIAGVSTSTTAFVGSATAGVIGRAVAIQAFAEFEARFGGLDRQSQMSYAVRQFFLNGGRDAVIVRVPTYGDSDDLTQVFLGDRSRGEGIYALDSVALVNLLCLPGISHPAVLAAAAALCGERRAFLIVDAPSRVVTPDDMVAFVTGADLPRTENAALYYPWIGVSDPLENDAPRSVPPSGTIAGLFARTDAARGVWKAPAGSGAQLLNVAGVSHRITDDENERLNARAVNCVRVLPASGPVCWGARTLLGDDRQGSEWKYVPVRRMALYLEESIDRGLAWTVFEPNDEPLWVRIRAAVEAFMHGLFRHGAFQGTTPREAYFVRCDGTTQSDIEAGAVDIAVGFAPLKPSEFVILKIRHRTGEARRESPELQRVPSTATFSDLALPQSALQHLRDLIAQVRERKPRRLVLFSAPARTGRTIAAEVIATELGRDLYRLDLRQVVSKYIGETEKNIARVLDAAELVGGILMFDEAEALFGKRTAVHDSHDRYANIEIEHLLQRIECFPGLVVLATNATENIDPRVRQRLRCIDMTTQ